MHSVAHASYRAALGVLGTLMDIGAAENLPYLYDKALDYSHQLEAAMTAYVRNPCDYEAYSSLQLLTHVINAWTRAAVEFLTRGIE